MTAYALLGLTFITAVAGLVSPESAERIHRVSRAALYPAEWLLGMGIITGAVWANISWGRILVVGPEGDPCAGDIPDLCPPPPRRCQLPPRSAPLPRLHAPGDPERRRHLLRRQPLPLPARLLTFFAYLTDFLVNLRHYGKGYDTSSE